MQKNYKIIFHTLPAVVFATFLASCDTMNFDEILGNGYDDYYYEDDAYYDEEYETDEYEEKLSSIREITPRGIMDRMDSAGSYDLIGGYEPISETEIKNAITKWADGNATTNLRNYKGHTIEIKKTSAGKELKEMRIKFMMNEAGRPLNKRISEILNEISDAETVATCGMNAKPLIIYNKPSFEIKQATTFYEPEVIRSQYIREYAYRCLY
jgi:hypothetical protein